MEPSQAITDYFFTQGILGVVVLGLGIVVVYLQRKLDKKEALISELQNLRLADSKEVTRDVTTVLQQNSQSNLVLAEKIETAKRDSR